MDSVFFLEMVTAGVYMLLYMLFFFYYFDYFYNFGCYIIKQDKRKRNVITEADGKHAILPLKKSSNLKEINEKQGNVTLVKQNKKRKRKVISETDDEHPVPPLKIFLKLKENDEKQ